MAINIAQGYNPSTTEPIDSRFVVANSASRYAFNSLINAYEGLLVYQKDTNQLFQLIDTASVGSEAGWEQISLQFENNYRALYTNANGFPSDNRVTNVVLLREFDNGGNFGQILQNGINNAPTGSILDCTDYTGSQQITSSVIITKPINIRLGEINITASFTSPTTQSHAFLIQGINGVSIQGMGRSPRATLLSSPTTIEMRTSGSGYHIFATGSNVLTFNGFDCYGIQSTNYNINTGAGGICLIEQNPGVSGGGNNVNQVLIESVFVDGTRDHGIWILGGILAQIRNSRVSSAGGHGFYISTGTTTTYLLNCYASSGVLAGFCIDESSYSQLQNCAAEFFGIGYWLRSSFNISLLGCGAEQNDDRGTIPSSSLKIFFPNSLGSYEVDDIGGGNTAEFRGTSYLVTGGRNIYIPVPYSKDPSNNIDGKVVKSAFTRHYKVKGNARAVYLVNPRCQGNSPVRFDLGVEASGPDTPRDVNLFFNPVEDGTVQEITQSIFTSSIGNIGGTFLTIAGQYIFTGSGTNGGSQFSSSVILDQGQNTEIKNGTTYYTDIVTSGSLYSKNTIYAGSSVSITTQSSAPTWVGSEGEIVPGVSGGNYYIYVYMGGNWRSSSLS
jgi:hypothetical protein